MPNVLELNSVNILEINFKDCHIHIIIFNLFNFFKSLHPILFFRSKSNIFRRERNAWYIILFKIIQPFWGYMFCKHFWNFPLSIQTCIKVKEWHLNALGFFSLVLYFIKMLEDTVWSYRSITKNYQTFLAGYLHKTLKNVKNLKTLVIPKNVHFANVCYFARHFLIKVGGNIFGNFERFELFDLFSKLYLNNQLKRTRIFKNAFLLSFWTGYNNCLLYTPPLGRCVTIFFKWVLWCTFSTFV